MNNSVIINDQAKCESKIKCFKSKENSNEKKNQYHELMQKLHMVIGCIVYFLV